MIRYEVIIPPQAWRAIDGVYEYIATESRVGARALRSRIEQTIRKLDCFPLRGAVAPEGIVDGFTIRHKVVGKYRVLYTVEHRVVVIVGVRHSSRLSLR